MKNKLFFFADWEGTFEQVGFSSLFSVPPADFRRGDFTHPGAGIVSAPDLPVGLDLLP